MRIPDPIAVANTLFIAVEQHERLHLIFTKFRDLITRLTASPPSKGLDSYPESMYALWSKIRVGQATDTFIEFEFMSRALSIRFYSSADGEGGDMVGHLEIAPVFVNPLTVREPIAEVQFDVDGRLLDKDLYKALMHDLSEPEGPATIFRELLRRQLEWWVPTLNAF